jgi:hypothetical protein
MNTPSERTTQESSPCQWFAEQWVENPFPLFAQASGTIQFRGERSSFFQLLTLRGDCGVEWGADAPCGVARHPLSRTVLATCHRTRLSLYLSLARVSVGKRASVQQMMTRLTEDECFPPSGDHHPLPDGLSRFNVFKFPNMVDLKGTLPRFAVFTLPRIQTVDEFRPAERKPQRVWRCVNVLSACGRLSEVFETEEPENARPVFFRQSQDIPILRLESGGHFVNALTMFVGQRFEETGLPDVGQFVHALLDITGQCVVIGQPLQFSVVGKKDFCIRKPREFSSRGHSHRVVISVALALTEAFQFSLWDMQLDAF